MQNDLYLLYYKPAGNASILYYFIISRNMNKCTARFAGKIRCAAAAFAYNAETAENRAGGLTNRQKAVIIGKLV